MKRLIYLAALVGGAVLTHYSVAGEYIALALIFAAVISAAENLFSSEVPEVRISTPVTEEGSAPRLYFRTKKALTCVIASDNSFTHETTEIPLKIKQSGEVTLPEFENCGELHFSFKKLRRFDLCGLTSRRVQCVITGKCTVMPKAKLPPNIDPDSPTSSERELSGAREYVQGDELRRINFKLTHRFSKIYINTYSPEENGQLCLFFDTACPDDTTVFAEKLRELAGMSRLLSARGTDHCAVFMGAGGFVIMRNARSGLDEILAAILSAPTQKGESTLPNFLADPRSSDLGTVICFSPF